MGTGSYFGKISPQSKESEVAVLGAVLLNKNAINVAMLILKPECFYTEAHQLVFESMLRLQTSSRAIDLITVAEDLRKADVMKRVGETHYLTQLTYAVVSDAHLEDHCIIVLYKYILRELAKIGMTTFNASHEASAEPKQIIDSLSKELIRLQGAMTGKDFKDLSTTLVEVLADLMNPQIKMGGCTFIHKHLRNLIPSVRAGDFVILAARPSVGKTAFALEFAMGEAAKGKSVAFFSMEMSSEQLVQRIVSSVSGVPFAAIYNRHMSDVQMRKFYAGCQKISEYRLHIDDSYMNSFGELEAKAMGMKMSGGLDLVVIDYLQLIGTDNSRRSNTRTDDVSAISRRCKVLAKAIGAPVVALSQMSRAIESSGRREPKLSDLRESGAIEQDADVVIFLYREDEEEIPLGDPVKVSVKVAKHRNGALGKTMLTFDGNYMKFYEVWEQNSGSGWD